MKISSSGRATAYGLKKIENFGRIYVYVYNLKSGDRKSGQTEKWGWERPRTGSGRGKNGELYETRKI
jgi:hypothetical protein